MYLVIDTNHMEVAEQYKLFTQWESALKHAKSRGYEDPFGINKNLQPGFKFVYMCDDILVQIVRIEVST